MNFFDLGQINRAAVHIQSNFAQIKPGGSQ